MSWPMRDPGRKEGALSFSTCNDTLFSCFLNKELTYLSCNEPYKPCGRTWLQSLGKLGHCPFLASGKACLFRFWDPYGVFSLMWHSEVPCAFCSLVLTEAHTAKCTPTAAYIPPSCPLFLLWTLSVFLHWKKVRLPLQQILIRKTSQSFL